MTECQLAIGKPHANGHIRLRWRGRTVYAHRLAWEQAYGPIPPRRYVKHECGNPVCVNPAHLYISEDTRGGA